MILTQDPAIAASPAHIALGTVGAVRRPVALLMVELLLDEELELETAGSELAQARTALADVAARHGGSLASESGAELVASFGVEGAREDDVLRAARTAVELREIVRARELDARFAVGAGRLLVEDGRPVLVGVVVGQTRRALHEAVGGEIVVTPSAARLAGDALELAADGRLERVRPGRPRPSVESAPFVGRAAELAALRSAFEEVALTGFPRHVIVVGEAGMGKTRLVGEALEAVDAVVLTAACVPYGEGITFLPLRELAERAVAVDPEAPELGDPRSADAAFAAVRALLEHFTASTPVVVVLDDVHWALPTFLDLVEYVVRTVNGPLLVVSLARPEILDQRPEWGRAGIRLDALADDDAAELVGVLPENDELDARLRTAILAASDGVPLYLEQMVAFATESDLASDAVPPPIETLLASRIDALEPGERSALSRAAIVGRQFSVTSVHPLTPGDGERELDARFASLSRRRLLRPRDSDYEFVHPLVHVAAYDAIGRRERASLHLSFARWLDGRHENDDVIAFHLERAALEAAAGDERDELSAEASDRLRLAGTNALAAFDHAAAANLLERAVSLRSQHDPLRLELECELGYALKGLGAPERAAELLGDVAARARAAGERRLEFRAEVELVWPRLDAGMWTVDDAVALLDEARTCLTGLGDVLGVARLEATGALTVGDWGNRADLGLPYLERAEAAYRSVGIVGRLDTTAVSLALDGTTHVDQAIAMCEERIASNPALLRTQAYLRCRLAMLRALKGDLDGAREIASTAKAELEDLGEEAGLRTSAAAVFGSVEALAEDWTRAREIFGEALEHARERPERRSWHAYFLARLGEAALGREDGPAAVELADRARAIAVASDVETEIWCGRVAARAASATGHPRKAARLARDAVTASDRTDNIVTRGQARLDLADVLSRSGGKGEALAAVREAIELFERKGADLPAGRARARFADLLVDADGGGASANAPPEHVA